MREIFQIKRSIGHFVYLFNTPCSVSHIVTIFRVSCSIIFITQLHLQVLEMCMPKLSKLIDIMDQLQYIYHRSTGTMTI